MQARATTAAVAIGCVLLLLSYFVTTRHLERRPDPVTLPSHDAGVQEADPGVELDQPPHAGSAARSESTTASPIDTGGINAQSADSGGLKVWETKYKSGKPMGRVLVDSEGRKYGEFEAWYEDGSIKTRGRYDADLQEGPWVSFYPNGATQDLATYEHGKLVGSLLQWHDNGQVLVSKTLRNGKGNGPCTMWWKNGRLQAMGDMEDSLPSGPWTWWKEDGALDAEKTGTYLKGKRVQ